MSDPEKQGAGRQAENSSADDTPADKVPEQPKSPEEPNPAKENEQSKGPSDNEGFLSKGPPTAFTRVQATLLMFVILAVFAVATLVSVFYAFTPAMQADAPSDAPPRIICIAADGASVEASNVAQPSPSSGSMSPTPSASRPLGSAAPTTSVESLPTGNAQAVSCPSGTTKTQFEPQRRAAFDPSARLTAILAVILPLVTTFVAFYYGERAGAKSASESASRDFSRELDELARKVDELSTEGKSDLGKIPEAQIVQSNLQDPEIRSLIKNQELNKFLNLDNLEKSKKIKDEIWRIKRRLY